MPATRSRRGSPPSSRRSWRRTPSVRRSATSSCASSAARTTPARSEALHPHRRRRSLRGSAPPSCRHPCCAGRRTASAGSAPLALLALLLIGVEELPTLVVALAVGRLPHGLRIVEVRAERTGQGAHRGAEPGVADVVPNARRMHHLAAEIAGVQH